MTCDEARAAFTELYDGALSGEPLADLSRHLDGCSACRREWAAFRRTLQSLKDLGAEDPSHGFAARVAERLEAPRWWQRAARSLVFPLPVKLPLHAAALLVLGMAGIWVSQRSPELQRAVDVSPALVAERPTQATPSAPPQEVPRQAPSPPSKDAAPKTIGPAHRSERATPAAPARDELAPSPPAGSAGALESESAASGRPRSTTGPLESSGRAASEFRTDMKLGPARERALPAPAAGTGDEVFSAAAADFAAQRYAKAIEEFGVFLARHPTDPRAPDAHFSIADAYRALGRHEESSAGFAAFLRRYPGHRMAPAALFRQAENRLAAADPSGCAMLRDALARYPEALEAASARETLAARCP